MVCATQVNVATRGEAGSLPDDFMPAWPEPDDDRAEDHPPGVVPESVAELARLRAMLPAIRPAPAR